MLWYNVSYTAYVEQNVGPSLSSAFSTSLLINTCHLLAPAFHDSSVLLGSERVAGRLGQRLDLTGQVVAAGTGSQDEDNAHLNSSQGEDMTN